jgi:chromosome segregation ATPase
MSALVGKLFGNGHDPEREDKEKKNGAAAAAKLFGNGQLPDEVRGQLRAILLQMRNERNAFERVAAKAQRSLEKACEPAVSVAPRLSGLDQRLGTLEERLRAVEQLALSVEHVEEQQRHLSSRVNLAQQDAERIEALLGPIRDDLEQTKPLLQNADQLRTDLEPLLELGGQTQTLRSDVSALRQELDDARESLGGIREQTETMEQRGTAAVERIETLESTFGEVSEGVRTAEEQLTELKGSLDSVTTLAEQVPDLRRELNTLRALREYVGQKIAELEEQRDLVNYATNQGMRLAELVRRLDSDLEAQQENAKVLVRMEEDVSRLHAVHDELTGQLDRLADRQRESARVDESRRAEFKALHELMEGRIRDTISRFEFEQERLETATTQIADLRKALSDAEGRFESLREAKQDVAVVRTELTHLNDRVASIAMDLAPLDSYVERMTSVKADIRRAEELVKEVAGQAEGLQSSISTNDSRLAALQELAERTEQQTRDLTKLRDYLSQFEQRVAKFEVAEAAVEQAIDDAARRQATVEVMRADFNRMLQIANETADQVRVIVESHDDIVEGRRLVDDVLSEIGAVMKASERLDARHREVEAIDDQVARAEAVIIDVRNTLESLHEQKGFLEQAMETAGSLRFQSKRAEALIETLRERNNREKAAAG